MNYAVAVGSDAIIFTPSFTKISSGFPNLIGEIYKQTAW
jgi:hypothetical protein